VITQLRADLEKVRMLSEQVQKRERLKLEQTKKLKAYLEMIFFPLEYVIRPILNQFMEIDRKKLFLNHVTIDEAADYRTIIQQPMCFSEIYQKLANHSYSTLDQFKNDIQLIWKNSMDYNTADTNFYKVAIKLKNASQKLFDSAEEKMNCIELLQDGMLQKPLDESIFSYDASFQEEQDNLSDLEQQSVEVQVDTEAEAQLRLERERLRAEKEEEHRRAIKARIEGRARARALREENKRRGILPTVNPAEEKAKLRTLRKLRTQNNQTPTSNADATDTVDALSDAALIEEDEASIQEINSDSKTTDSNLKDTNMQLDHDFFISSNGDDTQNRLIEAAIQQKTGEHTAEQVYDLKVEQSINLPATSNSSISYVSAPSSLSTTAIDNSTNLLPIEDLIVDADNKITEVKQMEAEQNTSIKGKEKNNTISLKRQHPSQRVTPRLTRSNGLKASIEELTKRPKISHEARALFASYNGVSHLDRPVEVYKENRKIHAPIGWVYLDDEEGEEEEEEEGEREGREGSHNMDIDEEENKQVERKATSVSAASVSIGPPGSAKKYTRQGRNDIPIPQFNRGEIIWARVNGYPSHPAKVSKDNSLKITIDTQHIL
jgi:hypothetical protein